MELKLNQAALQELAEIMDGWIDSLSEPLNEGATIAAIDLLYETLGRKRPTVIYLASPWSVFLTGTGIELSRDNKDRSVFGQIIRSLLERSVVYSSDGKGASALIDKLEKSVSKKLGNEVHRLFSTITEVFDRVFWGEKAPLLPSLNLTISKALKTGYFSPLAVGVDRALNDAVQRFVAPIDDLEKVTKVRAHHWNCVRLVHDIDRAVRCEFAKRCLDTKFDVRTYNLFMSLHRHAPFFSAYEDFVLISDKPSIEWKSTLIKAEPPINFEFVKKIPHSEDKPAVQFADGFGVWMLDGEFVDPHDLRL